MPSETISIYGTTTQHKGSDLMGAAVCRYYVPNIFESKKGQGYCCRDKLEKISHPCIYDIWSAHPQITPADDNEPANMEVAEEHCSQPGFCKHYTSE
jgi:hypothetical protein